MTNPASLFDDLDGTEREPGEIASRFESMNRSTRTGMENVRVELERWYSRYPDPCGHLRSRFRADANHDGAFFELFLHELFLRLGLSVETEPRTACGSRRPDFLVSGEDGSAYVEATYLEQRFQPPPLEAAVFDAINKLDGHVPPNVGVHLEVDGTLECAPAQKLITNQVRKWLNEVSADDVALGRDVTALLIPVDPKYGDWKLRLRAVPRNATAPVIVVGPVRECGGVIGKELRRAVTKKARKYQNLEHPLIVAVSHTSLGAEQKEVAALLGHEARRFPRNGGGNRGTAAERVRTGKAVWFDSDKGIRHPRLSAVMMFRELAPWTVANVSACLYLNPYVDVRVPRQLRTLGYVAGADGQLRWYEGARSTRDVLALPRDWPGNLRRRT